MAAVQTPMLFGRGQQNQEDHTIKWLRISLKLTALNFYYRQKSFPVIG